jgi:hypothetical protein
MTELTREEKRERLIEAQYDGMDFKDLFHFVHYYLTEEYKDWSDESFDEQYKAYFPDDT